MPRKSRRWKDRPGKYRGGQVIVNKKDYTRRDYMSPGRLVAWAEWVPKRRGELIRTNDKIVGVKRDYKTGPLGRKENENETNR